MPRLLRKNPELIPRPTGVLPAGADHADWCVPVAELRVGLRVLQTWTLVHVNDPMVARRPDLFRRCSDGQPVGPAPQTSGHTLTGL